VDERGKILEGKGKNELKDREMRHFIIFDPLPVQGKHSLATEVGMFNDPSHS